MPAAKPSIASCVRAEIARSPRAISAPSAGFSPVSALTMPATSSKTTPAAEAANPRVIRGCDCACACQAPRRSAASDEG
ncbi:Uncharacterised protein [Bordetella pertussis]|nr:Uncharacterised protein [Bordetella pertussis]